jgi:diadenosine tetraphosphate (Ap4A) HIT family hydrolase
METNYKLNRINSKIKKCLICTLNKTGIFCVYRGKQWLVDRPMDIKLNGLFFLKTKRHLETIERLNDREKKELGFLLTKFARKSKRLSNAKRVLVWSLGLKDPHVHFWIVPYTDDNEKEILGISKAVKKLANKYRE